MPTIKYAGFWVRAGALLVDGIILGILQQIIKLIFGTGNFVTLLLLVLGWIYTVFMLTNYQATLGKMAVGLHVERVNGEKIGFWRACLREIIGKSLSILILGIGYFMVGWTQKKQGLHDMVADTIVVENDPNKSKTVWVVIGAIFVALIPILVAVGIFSAIALTSLSVAKTKGNDAIVESNFAMIQTQAEIYYSGSGKNSYAGICSNPAVTGALSSIQTANGGTPPVCNDSAAAYAAGSPLATDPTKFWCVDSTGTAAIVPTSPVIGQTSCK